MGNWFSSSPMKKTHSIQLQNGLKPINVAILAEKYPLEIGNLMVYAQTVQKLSSHVGTKLLFNRTKSFVVGDKRIHLLVLGNLKILNCFSNLFNIHPASGSTESATAATPSP